MRRLNTLYLLTFVISAAFSSSLSAIEIAGGTTENFSNIPGYDTIPLSDITFEASDQVATLNFDISKIFDSNAGYGSWVIANGGNARITTSNGVNLKFENLTGAISTGYSEKVSIIGTANNKISFSDNNRAIVVGSALVNIKHASFDNNHIYSTAPGGDTGGAILNNYGNVSIDSSAFRNNVMDSTTVSLGGAISIMFSGSFDITDTHFYGNEARSSGSIAYAGAIATNASTNWIGPTAVNIAGVNETVVFDSNKAISTASSAYGGAIHNRFGTVMTIDNALFSNNLSSGVPRAAGGAISNTSNAVMTISNTTFIGNEATSSTANSSHSGAIYNTTATATIKNSNFNSNTASMGGAISNINGGTISIENSEFSNNSSGQGGALHVNTGTATITDTNFINNIENNSFSGGAIYNKDATLSINVTAGKTSTFSGNISNGRNSAIGLHGNSIMNINTAQGATLDMQDAIGGYVNDGEAVSIVKSGAGTWMLGGESVMNKSAGNTGYHSVALSEGVLKMLDDSTLLIEGSESEFTVDTAANLDLNALTETAAVNISEGSLILQGEAIISMDANNMNSTDSVLNASVLDIDYVYVKNRVIVDVDNLSVSYSDDVLVVLTFDTTSSDYGTEFDANDYFVLARENQFWTFKWADNALLLVQIPEASETAILLSVLALGFMLLRRRK